MDRITSMTTFTTVVTSGSFAAAAQRLNMSPAAVTNHIQSLEERLGARLLNRTTRKLSLTEAGREYFDRCAQILAQIEEADTTVAALHSTPRGRLRLNAASVLSFGIASLIGEFAAAYPDITIELITTDQMVDLVEEGIDVAIRFKQAQDSSLIVRRLGQFSLVVCGSPSYIQRHGEPVHPGELSQHNCISYMHPGYTAMTREWTLMGPDGEITVPINGNLHTNSPETIRLAALEGRGLIMSPTFFVDQAVRNGQLVRVLRDYHLGEIPVIALYPHRHRLSGKVRAFLDFAARHFAEDPRWRLDCGGGPCL